MQQKVRDLSLCLLFQRGQCKAGSKCHQIHADPNYISSLREQAAAGNSCCAAHGDVCSAGFLQQNRSVAIVDATGSGMAYPLSCFGRTQLLDQMLRTSGGLCRIPENKICRLHGQGRCKFGRDCKNVHLCRKGATTPAVNAVAPLTSHAAHGRDAASLPPAIRRAEPLDIDDDDSCGISTRSCSVYSTPGKATHLAGPPMKPVELRLCNDDLFKPLKAVSPTAGVFCVEGFETSIRSLCDDVTCAEFVVITSPTW